MSGVDDKPTSVSEDPQITIGDHIVRLHRQRIEIRDMTDGDFIMLKAEEAEQLR